MKEREKEMAVQQNHKEKKIKQLFDHLLFPCQSIVKTKKKEKKITKKKQNKRELECLSPICYSITKSWYSAR